jgi:hypothetical protein
LHSPLLAILLLGLSDGEALAWLRVEAEEGVGFRFAKFSDERLEDLLWRVGVGGFTGVLLGTGDFLALVWCSVGIEGWLTIVAEAGEAALAAAAEDLAVRLEEERELKDFATGLDGDAARFATLIGGGRDEEGEEETETFVPREEGDAGLAATFAAVREETEEEVPDNLGTGRDGDGGRVATVTAAGAAAEEEE